jgi:hypothetical protein
MTAFCMLHVIMSDMQLYETHVSQPLRELTDPIHILPLHLSQFYNLARYVVKKRQWKRSLHMQFW